MFLLKLRIGISLILIFFLIEYEFQVLPIMFDKIYIHCDREIKIYIISAKINECGGHEKVCCVIIFSVYWLKKWFFSSFGKFFSVFSKHDRIIVFSVLGSGHESTIICIHIDNNKGFLLTYFYCFAFAKCIRLQVLYDENRDCPSFLWNQLDSFSY